MDVLVGLLQLGFTEYEARAYVALLSNPGGTGYEVAKYSGIPRAKIYEVLGSLVARGVVSTSQSDGRALHHALDPESLLRRQVGQVERLRDDLVPVLSALAAQEVLPPLVTIKTYPNIIAGARDIVATARRQLFVSGWWNEVEAILAELTMARKRKVDTYVVVYGEAPPARPRWRHWYSHEIDNRRRISGPPWFIVAADHAEALIGEPTPGSRAVALRTRNRGVAIVASEYIKHDIFLLEASRIMDEKGINLNHDLAHLQSMWFGRRDSDLGGDGSDE